jgi:replication factor A1
MKQFTRKNGLSGKVVNIELTDSTGRCLLVLWDKKVELVTSGNIQHGTSVKVINGYVKERYGELQVYLGRWGLLELEPEDLPPLQIQKPLMEDTTIEGRVKEVDPTHAFFKDDGTFGFVTHLKIQDEKDDVHTLTIWDEKVKELQRFQVGEHICIKNIDRRQKNGQTEMHVNGRSTITRL